MMAIPTLPRWRARRLLESVDALEAWLVDPTDEQVVTVAVYARTLAQSLDIDVSGPLVEREQIRGVLAMVAERAQFAIVGELDGGRKN